MDGFTACIHRAVDIDGEDTVPPRICDFSDRFEAVHDAGIIDEDIHFTEESDCSVNHGIYVGFDGDIGFDGSCSVRGFRVDFTCDFFGTFEVIIGNDHFCAFFSKQATDGFAHTRSASSYNSDFVHQFYVVLLLMPCWSNYITTTLTSLR